MNPVQLVLRLGPHAATRVLANRIGLPGHCCAPRFLIQTDLQS